MGVLLFLLLSYLVLCYGLSLVFGRAAGHAGAPPALQARDAWIPGLNFARWCELVGRRPAHALWLLVPIVNVFIYAGLCVDLARSFGRFGFGDAAAAVALSPLYAVWLGRNTEVAYEGPVLEAERVYAQRVAEARAGGETLKANRLAAESPYLRSPTREWVEAIVFAVSAAALIRLFVFEMYVIPTSSMEGTMLVGDYLLVSKAHYGIRTPQTIAMVPLLHNRLPFDAGESYWEWPQLDMHRLPAIESIDRNDPIVFNYPLGDSVYVLPGRTWSAEDVRLGRIYPQHVPYFQRGLARLVTRPLDKKDHYVKRAVAVAGDTVEIRDSELYINGQRADDPPHIQYSYRVSKPPGLRLDPAQLAEWGISSEDLGSLTGSVADLSSPELQMVLSDEQVAQLKTLSPDLQVVRVIAPRDTSGRMPSGLFPNDPANFAGWSRDNFGPLYVPQAGATVEIGPRNIALYRRIISVYEGHDLRETAGGILIDGQPARTYTFEQDYYWAMGDNRHMSEDSRYWGFVPHDHIVGKPLFIWFSTRDGSLGNGIRWGRIFKGATQMDD